MKRGSVLAVFLAAIAGAAYAQAVVSTRSGVVHYFEGSVSIDGAPLEARLGRFATLNDGGVLRTEKGRAEILLTPGVFLRVGENSAVRMVASSFADTRIEIMNGSAIVDTREPVDGNSVTVNANGWSVRQSAKGSYRIDSEPPRLRVREGRAQASCHGEPVAVAEGMELALKDGPPESPEAVGTAPDALRDWSDGRDDAIAADNAVSANIQDPATMSTPDLGLDGFTYYPMLPLSSLSYGLGAPVGTYGSYGLSPTYQTGFYSIYLPGYTRRPLGLTLPAVTLPGTLHTLYPPRTGLTGLPVTRYPGITTPHPISPAPVRAPAPVHAPVHVIHR